MSRVCLTTPRTGKSLALSSFSHDPSSGLAEILLERIFMSLRYVFHEGYSQQFRRSEGRIFPVIFQATRGTLKDQRIRTKHAQCGFLPCPQFAQARLDYYRCGFQTARHYRLPRTLCISYMLESAFRVARLSSPRPTVHLSHARVACCN
jgi:hypothetical protein